MYKRLRFGCRHLDHFAERRTVACRFWLFYWHFEQVSAGSLVSTAGIQERGTVGWTLAPRVGLWARFPADQRNPLLPHRRWRRRR